MTVQVSSLINSYTHTFNLHIYVYVFLQVCKLRRVSHRHTHKHSHSNFKKAVGIFLNACKNNKQWEHSESPDDCLCVYMMHEYSTQHMYIHVCTVRIFVINVFYYCMYVCMSYTYVHVCVHTVWLTVRHVLSSPHTRYSSLTKSCLPRLSLHLHTAALLTVAM